jgi:hypothetical protein
MPEEKATSQNVPWATFLETSPPNVREEVSEFFTLYSGSWIVAQPDLQLHCSSENCGGSRFFAWRSDSVYVAVGWSQFFARYTCRNCQKASKVFAVGAHRPKGDSEDGVAVKFGELPEFGPPVPSRVISLIGPDRDMFLRGRRSENQGLGIGAFGYYRRVVENQKGRLIGEIAKVAARLGASPESMALLAKAEQENQFSRAVDSVKSAIPQALLIDGHNPLLLLHNALSKGLHAKTDEECLELATSIRVVLTELAERMSLALKDEAELKQALSKLLNAGEPNE